MVKEIIEQLNEESELQKKYRDYFNGLLKKYNASSPADMNDETMKKFFNDVRTGWVKGKGPK